MQYVDGSPNTRPEPLCLLYNVRDGGVNRCWRVGLVGVTTNLSPIRQNVGRVEFTQILANGATLRGDWGEGDAWCHRGAYAPRSPA